jgi:hypothetical protein
MRKTFWTITAVLSLGTAAFADTIVSPDAGFISVPGTFQSTTGSGSAPFWNNRSSDGLNMNAGDFLTGSNSGAGMTTDYLGFGGGLATYLSTSIAGMDATGNFSFLQSDLSASYQLLYSNAGANMTSTYGTSIGLYDVNDPAQKIVLFDHGTLYNPAAGSNGVYNNNLSALPSATVNTFANYGLYATTCGFGANGIYCDTYYSNVALDQTSEAAHQHFAVFQDNLQPLNYFIAFEDCPIGTSIEGVGDYNDVIFNFQTTKKHFNENNVPEPATWGAMGLGLVGLVVLRRRTAKA